MRRSAIKCRSRLALVWMVPCVGYAPDGRLQMTAMAAVEMVLPPTVGPPPGRGVSSVEVYGFAGWITSSVAYVVFVLWAYTPSWMLEAHGVTYYPSNYWAVALPVWVCTTVVFVYWLNESLCMMSAAPAGAIAALRDPASKSKEEVGLHSYFAGTERSIPPLVDIPPELISLVLHGGLSPQEAEEVFDKQRRTKLLDNQQRRERETQRARQG